MQQLAVRLDHGDLTIAAVTPTIIRICARHPQMPQPRPSLVVIASVEDTGASLAGERLDTSALVVTYDRGADAVTVARRDGTVLLREAPGARVRTPVTVDGEPALAIAQRWLLADGESIYGLGQHQDGHLDWRGQSCLLAPGNRQAALPLLVGHRGWGLLWDAAGLSRFTDGADGMTLATEAAGQLDYYVIDGGDLDGVVAGYRHLTGAAPLMPRWTMGYWQSRERYISQEQFLDVAAEHDRRRIPIDCLVQDWAYWGPIGWNAMLFDAAQWPDPAAAMRQLHSQHRLRAMISVWPSVGVDTPVHRELAGAGRLFTTIRHWGNAHVYDAFSDEGREIYGRHLRRGVLDQGFDALWLDGTEPEFSGAQGQEDCAADIKASGVTAAGSWSLVLNALARTGTPRWRCAPRWWWTPTGRDRPRSASVPPAGRCAGAGRWPSRAGMSWWSPPGPACAWCWMAAR